MREGVETELVECVWPCYLPRVAVSAAGHRRESERSGAAWEGDAIVEVPWVSVWVCGVEAGAGELDAIGRAGRRCSETDRALPQVLRTRACEPRDGGGDAVARLPPGHGKASGGAEYAGGARGRQLGFSERPWQQRSFWSRV